MRLSCDIEGVEPAFRLLLTSDGTVTDMLQVICREPIKAKKLAQEVQPAVRRFDLLDLEAGELLMRRRVLLQGDREVLDAQHRRIGGGVHRYLE